MSGPTVIESDLHRKREQPLSSLLVELKDQKSNNVIANQIDSIQANFQATLYLSVAQIFLQSNSLLEEKLKAEDVKSRLLGHFGTCPGLAAVYSNLSALIARNENESKEL